MPLLTNFNDTISESMKDPEFKREYDALQARAALAERLIHYRQDWYGWNQAELAKKAGVSLRTIQNIEDMIANPKLETLEKIADACSTTVYQLFWSSKDPSNN